MKPCATSRRRYASEVGKYQGWTERPDHDCESDEGGQDADERGAPVVRHAYGEHDGQRLHHLDERSEKRRANENEGCGHLRSTPSTGAGSNERSDKPFSLRKASLT